MKNRQGPTLRMNIKVYMCYRQRGKKNNIKLSRVQISKVIQSIAFSGALLNKLEGGLMIVVVPLAKKIF